MRISAELVRFLPSPMRKLLRWSIYMLQSLIRGPLELLPNSPDLFRVYRYLYQHPDVVRKPGGWFYNGNFYPDYLTVGGASYAIFANALRFCQGVGIDVGAGLWPLPVPIPIDLERGPGSGRTISDFTQASLDYVFSSHCLEHIEGWQDVLREWISKLKPKGIIFLYLPHPDCAIWNPGSAFVGDSHKWIPRPEVIKQAMQSLGCDILQYDDSPDTMQSFYVCGRKM